MGARRIVIAVAVTLVLAAVLYALRARMLRASPAKGSWVAGKWQSPDALAGKFFTLEGHVFDAEGRVAPGVVLRGAQPPADVACANENWPAFHDCLCNSTVQAYLEARARTPVENTYGVTADDGSFKVQVPRDEPMLDLSSPSGFGNLMVNRSVSGLEVQLYKPIARELTVKAPGGGPPPGLIAGSMNLLTGVELLEPDRTGSYPMATASWPFAWAPGYQLTAGSLFNMLGNSPSIELSPVGELSGEVLRGDAKVAGARVIYGSDRCVHETKTDSNGAFRFIDEGGFSFRRAAVVDGDDAAFGDWTTDAPLTLRLQPNAGPLTFRLKTRDGWLAHHLVSLEVQTHGKSAAMHFGGRTDEQGRVTFAALPPGSGKLSVWGYGVPEELKTLPLSAPPGEPRVVALEDERRLYLRVVDRQGRPQRTARITGPGGPASADSSGIAVLRDLPPGGAKLSLEDDALGTTTVDVPADGSQDVTLAPPVSLEVVVTKDGEPVAGQLVNAMTIGEYGSHEPGERRHCQTGLEGRCTLGFNGHDRVRVGLKGVHLNGNGSSWDEPNDDERDINLTFDTQQLELSP